MLQEFARLIHEKANRTFDPVNQRIKYVDLDYRSLFLSFLGQLPSARYQSCDSSRHFDIQ